MTKVTNMTRPKNKMTGRGKYKYLQSAPNDWTILLYNYDIEGNRYKPDHKQFLDVTVVPYLKAGCGIAIYGLASTTGTVEYDRRLGAERALDVYRYLRTVAGSSFPMSKLETRGKSLALERTGKDNTEDEEYRGVWLRVWDKQHPPPHIIDPGVVNPTFKYSDPGVVIFGQGLDVLGGVVSVIDLGLDISASYTGIVAAATGGIVTAGAGLVLAIVATIIGMPAIWASGDSLAEFNGKVEGYDEAMQDMAEQYSSDDLDRKPMRQWPAVREPSPHLFSALPIGTPGAFWRKGQSAGCRLAYMDALKLELNPIDVDVVTKDGKKTKTKANGRLMLRALWVTTKGEVAEKMVMQVNETLKQHGKPPWPTH